MHRGCFLWTPTPPLAGRRTPRPGPAHVCWCVLFLAWSGGPTSWARFGAPHLSFGRFVLLLRSAPYRAGVARGSVVWFFFSLFFVSLFPASPLGPRLSPAFCAYRPWVPWALALFFFSASLPGPFFFFPPPRLLVPGFPWFPALGALGLCALWLPPPPLLSPRFFFLSFFPGPFVSGFVLFPVLGALGLCALWLRPPPLALSPLFFFVFRFLAVFPFFVRVVRCPVVPCCLCGVLLCRVLSWCAASFSRRARSAVFPPCPPPPPPAAPLVLLPGPLSWSVVCILSWGAVLCCSVVPPAAWWLLFASVRAHGALLLRLRWLLPCAVACGCWVCVVGSGCQLLFSSGVLCCGCSCLAVWPAAPLCALVCCGVPLPCALSCVPWCCVAVLCRAVAPCCSFCFVGGVRLCPFSV